MNKILTDYGDIDKSVIVKFSESMGVAFPASYIDLLSEHNGLQFTENYFDYIDLNGMAQKAAFGFCGYGGWPVSEVIDNFQDHDEYGHNGVVVFGLRGNGDYICFDYRQDQTTNNPPIVLMHHDKYLLDENGHRKMAIVKVTDSFDAFISMLHK